MAGERATITPGIPSGVDAELLDQLILRHTGGRIARVSRQLLSNWKPGTYRLILESDRRSRWSVIFKDANYGHDVVPAQRDLPVLLGAPEFRVLSTNGGPLAGFLPTVYHAAQVGDQQHFRYYLEDLEPNWYRPTIARDLHAVVACLPGFHQALNSSIAVDDAPELIEYDEAYSVAVREYCNARVEHYLARRPSEGVEAIWQAWPEMNAVHAEGAPSRSVGTRIVHGDFNNANLNLARTNRRKLKAVDWEWAGFGFPHIDLASIAKGAPPDVQYRLVEAYANLEPQLSLTEHDRMFQWCRLQDAIRDAGYVAAQVLDSEHLPRSNPEKYIIAALKRARQAGRALSAG